MKIYIYTIVLLNLLVSCKTIYLDEYDRLSSVMEKRSNIFYMTNKKSKKTFIKRNIQLRSEMIKLNKNELRDNKNDFLIIEKYDYDGGYYSYIYLVVDKKVIMYKKDRSLENLIKTSYDYDNNFTIKTIIDKFYENNLNDLLKKNVNCLNATHIFVVSSDLKFKNHFEINCLPDYRYD